jgi:hypothetical protein
MIMVPIAMPIAAVPVVATTPVVVATTPVVVATTPVVVAATPVASTPALTAAHSGAPSEMLATAKMAAAMTATTAGSSWDQWCGEHQHKKANHEKYEL